MSMVMTSRKPAAAATAAAPTTPPAGPERSVRTGARRAWAADMRPPFDCMIRRAPRNPAEPSSASSRSTSRWTFGIT